MFSKNPFRLTEQQGRTAVARLLAVYLLVSALALLFPHRPKGWLLLLAAHGAGAALLLQWGPAARLLRSFAARTPRAARIVADWYGLLLIPAFYTELAVLNTAVFNGHYFDALILHWERLLFGGEPFRELAANYPSLWLSEYLHFAYISYYAIIYAPPLVLYLQRRRAEQQQLVFALLLTFFAHYLFFIYFPVQGPRYLFAAPADGIESGFFYNLAHQLLEAGSSRGAAFPSSHVGVSITAAAFAFVALPRWSAWTLLVLTLSLAVGAVYGGFHYATDAAAGLIFGLLLFWIAPHVAGRLAPGPAPQ